MTATKTTTLGGAVMYVIFDANGNKVTLTQGQPTLVGGYATAAVTAAGATARFTQTAVTTFNGPTAGSYMADADGDLVRFISPPPSLYAGGAYQSTSSGVRLLFAGTFVDLTTTNLSDIYTPMATFASTGVVS